VYAQVVLDSQKQWRAEHADYQKTYWRTHPEAAERNRQRQRQLDRQRRVTSLVKNNVALDLKHSAAEVWLVGPDAADLVKNNVAFSEVMVFNGLSPPAWNLVKNIVWFRRHSAGINEDRAMLTTEQINDLHRLYWSDHWPIRKIERHLHMGWDTIKKYLDMPAQTPAGRPRGPANSIRIRPPSQSCSKRILPPAPP
jgi:hypothetical protein